MSKASNHSHNISQPQIGQAPSFALRHIGLSDDDQQKLLRELGFNHIDGLMDKVVPTSIHQDTPLNLSPALSEAQLLAHLKTLSGKNKQNTQLIGRGYYNCHTPPVIQRNVLETPGWYTSYTPYQPEISQGRLEALLNYQTMICDLTGLPVTNASLLDEATAAGEAMALMRRSYRGEATKCFVHDELFEQTIDVLKTRAAPLNIELVIGPLDEFAAGSFFGGILAQTGKNGAFFDLKPVIKQAKETGCLVSVACDLLALCLLESPGSVGADLALGNSQRFGVPLFFGGPHAGFLAVSDKLKRALPGRIVGVSVDSKGRKAYRLSLQTREQHIRREKATSNICTAQALLAMMAGFYAQYHGPEGLKTIATRVHHLACCAYTCLGKHKFTLLHDQFFDTLCVKVPGQAEAIVKQGHKLGINLWQVDADHVSFSFDETSDEQTVRMVLAAFGVKDADALNEQDTQLTYLPEASLRRDAYLSHPVFHLYRSETEMMRYTRHLMDKDIALDRSMIPLGSCTMKLNPAASLMPVSFDGFAAIHPFAPRDQISGYVELIQELEAMLVEVTGYDAVSLQPNSGAQGEYAGLLAIRAFHHQNGEENRTKCLIPSSAHGTNPASAQMAGFDVVVVACDENGNIDVEDLKAKIEVHKADLGAIMITYPSTHGVFEGSIQDVCALVHDAGGQVYLDGANLNALVGAAQPGKFGADVSHLNLHKTFAIPHGGGGPGVGPVAVRSHLAPFLPTHTMFEHSPYHHGGVTPAGGAVSAAPYGSAGILPISYAYMKLMGADDLTKATQSAILAANYLAKKLGTHYPVLYKGAHGFVAHEAILDMRPLTAQTGISVEDIAKRLMDFGFHAPTMSWPVAGTLMIEPTESESLYELDRFIDAMIHIRAEIDQVAKNVWPKEDNPLANAPHPAADVTADNWTHSYARSIAAYPIAGLKERKYWPPVSRIDNVSGDRNLICSCPPLDSYES